MALALSLNKDSTPQSTPPQPVAQVLTPEKIEPRTELQQEIKKDLLDNALKLLNNDNVPVVADLLLRYAGKEKDDNRYAEAVQYLAHKIKSAIQQMYHFICFRLISFSEKNTFVTALLKTLTLVIKDEKPDKISSSIQDFLPILLELVERTVKSHAKDTEQTIDVVHTWLPVAISLIDSLLLNAPRTPLKSSDKEEITNEPKKPLGVLTTEQQVIFIKLQ